MPVPEPSAEGGLWAMVEPVTGWPETDEDRLTQLALGWRSGAERFTAVGGLDLTGLGGAWPDPAGTATGARARGTLLTVMGTADGMTMLADRVDAFAGAVRGCKVDIGRIVEAYIPGYRTARSLPPGLAESDASIILATVIAQVEERIGSCVREIGGLGLQPTDLPVDPVPWNGTLRDLLPDGRNPTTLPDPLPPATRTGGGPLISLPGLPGPFPAGEQGGDLPGIGPFGGTIDADGTAGGYEFPGPDVPTDVLEPGEGWEPADGTPIIGRQWDTKVGREWPDHDTLNIDGWNPEKNDAYIQTIIDQKADVYVGSPPEDNYWNTGRQEPTVYAREIQQLLQSGYRWEGQYLVPPP